MLGPVHGSRLGAVVAMASLLLAGCDKVGGTFNSFDVNQGSSVALSGDKRAILVLKARDLRADDKQAMRYYACAEPQPDAVRAVAQEIAAKIEAAAKSSTGQDVKGSGQLAAGARDAVASIGVRTPSIQLIRDLLYRSCEMVMNGILDHQDVGLVATRIDNIVIATHAVDGLTGMPVAPLVAIGAINAAEAKDGASAKASEVKIEFKDVPQSARSGADGAAIAREVRNIVIASLLEPHCRRGRSGGQDAQCDAAFRRDLITLMTK